MLSYLVFMTLYHVLSKSTRLNKFMQDLYTLNTNSQLNSFQKEEVQVFTLPEQTRLSVWLARYPLRGRDHMSLRNIYLVKGDCRNPSEVPRSCSQPIQCLPGHTCYQTNQILLLYLRLFKKLGIQSCIWN